MRCVARQRRAPPFSHCAVTVSLLILMGPLGCSDLVVRDDDSPHQKTRKVGARVLLFPLTLGWSEILLRGETARVADELFVDAYRRQLIVLVSDKQLSQHDAAQLLLREQALRARQHERRRRAWQEGETVFDRTTPQ